MVVSDICERSCLLLAAFARRATVAVYVICCVTAILQMIASLANHGRDYNFDPVLMTQDWRRMNFDKQFAGSSS